MSANLHLSNLDEDLIVRLTHRAARYGRSIEAEHWEILRQALDAEPEPSFVELAARLRALTAPRNPTPSEELLRQSREER